MGNDAMLAHLRRNIPERLADEASDLSKTDAFKSLLRYGNEKLYWGVPSTFLGSASIAALSVKSKSDAVAYAASVAVDLFGFRMTMKGLKEAREAWIQNRISFSGDLVEKKQTETRQLR